MAVQTGLSEGTQVDIEAQADGSFVVRKAKPRYTLEELLAGMTPDKAHPSWDDEPRGREFPNEES